MQEEVFAAMRRSVLMGAPDHARQAARKALESGVAPLEAINEGLVPAMNEVGVLFGCRQVFLPDLMASSEAMQAAMAILEPELVRAGGERPSLGTVVLGTTKGDIHEIGKCLVGTLLTANGFKVHDLGVDVAAERFAEKVKEVGAELVGVSALLTTTMKNQRGVVEALERAGLRPGVRVMVGGAPVTRQWASEIGAEGYGKDALSAVALAKELVPR